MSNIQYDTIVIGGGQSGLATAYYLQKAGLQFTVLEINTSNLGSWANYYESLKLFSPAAYSSLPGMQFPGDPNRYPTRNEVVQISEILCGLF
ncbi:FAD-dependent oxidoreductase [Paenibacillus sp. GP183]|uniref:FAD-dependent oxidoreductase n=1 Tax=Paenibacillus sp. GP183 TaxID=1882751 RepID=UPI000B1E894C|nr:FAD-dependent oxidoreductase [Paenibacillus sp. GP183]